MARVLPPYLNKMVYLYKKELAKAQKKELKAKKNYEFWQEYTNICRENLENAEKEENE